MEIIEAITEYWGIILTFAGIIGSFSVLKYQNSEQEKRIECLEDENKDIKTMQQSIDTRLAQIQTDLEWIKRSIGKN
ncbi:MAG TPA: hypothetical protein P5056_04240 [Candidatus Paceibacterota bacterium]|nr:hypothetical protein [Candidatus Paceibacterota bacterium]